MCAHIYSWKPSKWGTIQMKRDGGWCSLSPAPQFLVIKSPWSGKHQEHTVWGRVPEPNSWHLQCCSSLQSLSCTLQWRWLQNQHSSQMLFPPGPKHTICSLGFKPRSWRTYNLYILQSLRSCASSLSCISHPSYSSLPRPLMMYWSDSLFWTFNDSGRVDCAHIIFLSNILLHFQTV